MKFTVLKYKLVDLIKLIFTFNLELRKKKKNIPRFNIKKYFTFKR